MKPRRRKSPLVWSSGLPQQSGFYWHREDEKDDSPRVIRLYRDAQGEWSVFYGDLSQQPDDEGEDSLCDYLENWLHDGRAQWAFIPLPREP